MDLDVRLPLEAKTRDILDGFREKEEERDEYGEGERKGFIFRLMLLLPSFLRHPLRKKIVTLGFFSLHPLSQRSNNTEEE